MALKIVIVAGLVYGVIHFVERDRTILGLGTPPWPAALVQIVREGRPLIHQPVLASGRIFTGPRHLFRLKSWNPEAMPISTIEVKLPEWSSPITIGFKMRRITRMFTCASLATPIIQCRSIEPAAGVRLDKVETKREVYFADRGGYEYSQGAANVSMWRVGESTCLLHLEDWPEKGDAVRAEVDCAQPWIEQAARLRTVLDRYVPRHA